jgi:uncharacterized protein (DUF302 family)
LTNDLRVMSMSTQEAAASRRSSSPDDGLVTIESNYPVKDTIDRVEASLAAKGITVFARIDHAAGATTVDMPSRPTELLIFGNPKAGTPLMQSKQSIGIDLPLKMLGWQDQDGEVWLSYNDVEWLARRHELDAAAAPAIEALARFLADLAAAAAL